MSDTPARRIFNLPLMMKSSFLGYSMLQNFLESMVINSFYLYDPFSSPRGYDSGMFM
jgi:hypothetical protein